MGRKPRFTLAGHPQHVVQRGLDRQACFFSPADCRLYLELLGQRNRGQRTILANIRNNYSLTPNFSQFLEGELRLRILVEVIKTDGCEIGHHDIARQIALLETGEIINGLQVGRVQVFPA